MTEEQQPVEAPEETVADVPESTPEPVDSGPKEQLLTVDEKFKQHARTWERRAKESNSKVEQLEAQLAELTKARDEAVAARDEALAERSSMESVVMKYRVGRELGLPDTLCERLNGETEDDLRADAESIAKLLGRSTVNLSELSGGFEPSAPPRIDPEEIVKNMPHF